MKSVFLSSLTIKSNLLFPSLFICDSCSPSTGFALTGLAPLVFGQGLRQLHVVIVQ